MAQTADNLPTMQETWLQSLGWEGGHGNLLQHCCQENPHEQQYSPWGRKEWDTTEQLRTALDDMARKQRAEGL